jgi:CDP-diglyceride synthetase
MGAYLVGSLIGKHKVIPRISPGKTWEGWAVPFFFRWQGASVSSIFPQGTCTA